MLGGWAYGAIYRNSTERAAALDGWLDTTTITENTAPSATSPRSPASTSEPTCSGLTASRRRSAGRRVVALLAELLARQVLLGEQRVLAGALGDAEQVDIVATSSICSLMNHCMNCSDE